MKILFLSNRGLLPIKDGHTRRSFNILKGLALNNEVHFLSLFECAEEIDPQNLRMMREMCRHVELHPAPSKRPGVQMAVRLVRSFFSAEAYTIWRHYSGAFAARVQQYIDSESFDLVHCDILPMAYTVRGRKDIRKSITDHDVSFLKCLRAARTCSNPALKAFLYLEAAKLKRLEKRVFGQFDLGILVSGTDKRIIQQLCPDARLAVVENGVETERFRPSAAEPDPGRLVWVGGFDHHPNREGMHFFLKNIYPRIKPAVDNVKLDLIGGGRTGPLKKLIEGDPSIRLLGYVDDPLPFMHEAAVFVVPILTGGGTRLKVLEAMAAGKAIVSTTMGCEGIDGKPGVHYELADAPEAFAQKVSAVLKDARHRRHLEGNARQLAEKNYDFRHIWRKLDALYRGELGQQPETAMEAAAGAE